MESLLRDNEFSVRLRQRRKEEQRARERGRVGREKETVEREKLERGQLLLRRASLMAPVKGA